MKIITDSKLTASRLDQLVVQPPLKRGLDLVLTIFLFLLVGPILILIFLAQKLESLFKSECRGPFFYQETRISQGQPFNFYKIRIFKVAAMEKSRLPSGIIHTKPLENDKNNLTTLGKMLKKFYLDELGQLINVFKGEMSLVGTRPWNPADYQREVANGILRKKVIKAGITGLVQITKGHHHLYPGSDQGLDDYYINFCRTHSPLKILFFDLKIIFFSIIKLIKSEGL